MPRRPTIPSLQASLKRLSLEERQAILDWLAQDINAELNSDTEAFSEGAGVIDRRHFEGRSYQLERRRCNQEGCVCMDGDIAQVGHGPYWYSYWREEGKLKRGYVGKRPPWEETQAAEE